MSRSGTGLHIIVKGELPVDGCKRAYHDGHVEMYQRGRYFVMTGRHLDSTPKEIHERTQALQALHAKLNPPKEKPKPTTTHTTVPLDLDDDELLDRAREARNGPDFDRLWKGNTGKYPSASEADMALSCMLAFWTGRDHAGMDRLFRRSGLYRPKWDERHHGDGDTYGRRTIERAIQQTTEIYQPTPAGETRASAAPRDFHFTDLGNAKRLVAAHGENLRYVPHWKTWLIWDGVRWKRDEPGEIYRLAKQVVIQMYVQAAKLDADARKALVKHAQRSESERRLNAMVNLASTEEGMPVMPDQLDANPWLLNCLNGTIDLRTGTLRDHARDDLITKLAPVEYDPEATSLPFEDFLLKATNNDLNLCNFLCQAVGYSLTGDTSEDVLFFIYGPSKTGKTTFLEAIKATLGDYAKTADFTAFLKTHQPQSHQAALVALVGARFVGSSELDEGAKQLAEGIVKAMTGWDKIQLRGLCEKAFETRPTWKLWLAANSRPRVREDDEAMWERILQIPFSVQLPKEERDPSVKKRLADPHESGAAILAWALQGCLVWQKEGLTVPPAVETATEDYRHEMDPLRDFLSECCVEDPDAWTATGELFNEYLDFTGEKAALSKKSFTMKMVGHGYEKERRVHTGKTTRGLNGVRLRKPGDETDDSKTENNDE